ncbi:MAG: SRPBCC family protein [Pseudomonadota bacterium]
MKLVKGIAFMLVAIVALFFAVGAFLPSTSHVERSVTIDARPAEVFVWLNDFKKFNEWSPWAGIDPNTQYTFEGPASGVGSIMRWTSDHPDVGNGMQKIVASESPRRLVTDLDFGGMGAPTATFELEPEGQATRVTWMLDSDFGWNIVFRYFGLMMDTWVGTSYEEGLDNLKRVVES